MPKKTSSTPVVSTPVVAPAPPSAPLKERKDKKKQTVADEVPVVAPTPVPAAVPETAPAPVVEAVSEGAETSLAVQSGEFVAKLQALSVLISSLKTEYRTLEKKWSRDVKIAQKASSKHKRKSGNREPSGFVKPTKISDELAAFLGKDVGTEMARTAVTKEINRYIKENNLKNKKNGRNIDADQKLAALLKINSTDQLTYFNLQRYMSPHFAKVEKAAAATA